MNKYKVKKVSGRYAIISEVGGKEKALFKTDSLHEALSCLSNLSGEESAVPYIYDLIDDKRVIV